MKPSKGAPPSRRKNYKDTDSALTGGKKEFIMRSKIKRMKMPPKMEPIEKIDYEAYFEKAWNESMPSKKKSIKQMSSGKPNFKDIRQNKTDRAVLTKGMKK